MARFTDRATRPARGPGDIFRWRVLDRLPGRRPPRAPDFAALDQVRPAVRTDGAAALAGTAPVACWIGHASWVVRLGGALVAFDPVFSNRLGGVVRRLVPPGVALASLPPLDVVCVTHDHMDHLDVPSLRALGDGPTYVVPLGNGRRIARLGARTVVELDWWQPHAVGDLTITLVPARHWAMRAPWTRNQSLWGGYVVRSADGVLYHSGDTAGGDHFAEIGARMGPIDWAMLPIGAYAPRWFMEPQHCDPDDAGAGFLALGARHFLAMHWGTFRLTDEPIGEPPARLRAFWERHQLAPERLWMLDVGEARPLVR
ncbi:MAG: MBL fold metallo-hydrolase [Kofleriaceae bacterium]